MSISRLDVVEYWKSASRESGNTAEVYRSNCIIGATARCRAPSCGFDDVVACVACDSSLGAVTDLMNPLGLAPQLQTWLDQLLPWSWLMVKSLAHQL
jgi:hypothetical protein